jgi:hypothetical protein
MRTVDSSGAVVNEYEYDVDAHVQIVHVESGQRGRNHGAREARPTSGRVLMVIRIALAALTLAVPVAYGLLLHRLPSSERSAGSRIHLFGLPVTTGLVTAAGYAVVTERHGVALALGLVAYAVTQITAPLVKRLAERIQLED